MAVRFLYFAFILLMIFGFLQSCIDEKQKKGLTKKELISEIKQMYFNDQKYRRIIGILKFNCLPDSLLHSFPPLDEETLLATKVVFQPQLKIDDKNTERLIELTKQYGFPGMKHLNHDIPIFTVFVHSKKKYWTRIRKLIEAEYETGNVSDYEKNYIFWHLNGREGMIPQPTHSINFRKSVDIFKRVLEDIDQGNDKKS